MNQSEQDRMQRLRDARCPVHGTGLAQAGRGVCSRTCRHNEYERDSCTVGVPFWCYPVTCRRQGCGFWAWNYGAPSRGPLYVPQEVWDALPEGYPA